MPGPSVAAVERGRVAILGASGYTGAELLRLLLEHPRLEVAQLTADRQAGKSIGAVFPHLGTAPLPTLTRLDELDTGDLDAVFCCLPHGVTQEAVQALPETLKVVDLSADFRLRDPATYERWYGRAHGAIGLQDEAVYGLTELARPEIAAARLVANPGCYPTSAQLPLRPLLALGLIEDGGIVIDAKSGVTGAGRSLREDLLFPEVQEGFHAYGVAKHRHGPEIEQGLKDACGRDVPVSFTPHLLPINRGILATIYVSLKDGRNADDLHEALSTSYRDEPFVEVWPMGSAPATRHVRGTNLACMAVHADRVPGRAIILCAIDNLVKGASGQALQNMNLMLGLPETLALPRQALFP